MTIKEIEEMNEFLYYIKKLNLEKHPEGGYYKQIYKDKIIIKKEGLPKNFGGDRSCSTAIYYLINGKNFSAFHKIKSDEIWHYYEGNTSIKIYEIKNNGELIIHNLGRNIDNNENFVIVIEKDSWFAAELTNKEEKHFALVGCTVAPGFEFEDFKLAEFNKLSLQYPNYIDIIQKLSQ